MSEKKTTKKPAKEATSTEVKKENTEIKKENTEIKKENTEISKDSKTTKEKTTPKSASQSSISHFSSVSTPAYRSGWEQIFGNKEIVEDDLSNNPDDSQEYFQEFLVEDSSINVDLRNLLYKAFQLEAKKQGFKLTGVSDKSDIEYNLSCKIKNNN
jgi:hypothetical protein